MINFDIRHRTIDAKEINIGDRVILKDLGRESRATNRRM